MSGCLNTTAACGECMYCLTPTELQAKLAELRADRDNATRVVTELTAEVERLRANIDRYEALCRGTEAERDSLKAQLAEAQKRIEGMQATLCMADAASVDRAAKLDAAREGFATISIDLSAPVTDSGLREARDVAAKQFAALSVPTPKGETQAEVHGVIDGKRVTDEEWNAHVDEAVHGRRRADLMRVAEKVREACESAAIQDYSSRRSIEDSIAAVDLAAIVKSEAP